MLELVRKKEHIWDPRNELYNKFKSLRKSSLDEIAATLQELFPSMQGVLWLTPPVHQKKSNHRFSIVIGGRHLGG
ncbi:hypothetical protein E2C01_017439 [Portunus trituberculatus]|uniref:Uncharacterized protein n=1 Tax=Portunus trituberculatus TaxID=210409 RepID=A0A5B7DSG8_PORTR|nr:hypothetical protein [Portunus trituberculatus]